jgi:L-fuculose-phosphate aldolase
MLLEEERYAVVATARRLHPSGLSVGLAGNVSVRSGDHVAITPASIDYAAMTPDLVCVVDLDGTPVDCRVNPSNELWMHLGVYRVRDVRAVVHTHSRYATAVGTVRDELPAIHYSIAALGGPIQVSRYVTYGTPEQAEAVTTALGDRRAVLMRNHGATTVGATVEDAFATAVQVEWLCEVYHHASLLGSPSVLPPEEVETVRRKTAEVRRRAREVHERYLRSGDTR